RVYEDHALLEQPLIGRGAVVGEGADDFAVVVAVIGEAVGLHHGPVGEVVEQQVGRVVDARGLLGAGAAAERYVAAADRRVAANIEVGLDYQHRGTVLAGRDRRGQARRSGADN